MQYVIQSCQLNNFSLTFLSVKISRVHRVSRLRDDGSREEKKKNTWLRNSKEVAPSLLEWWKLKMRAVWKSIRGSRLLHEKKIEKRWLPGVTTVLERGIHYRRSSCAKIQKYEGPLGKDCNRPRCKTEERGPRHGRESQHKVAPFWSCEQRAQGCAMPRENVNGHEVMLAWKCFSRLFG